MSHRARAEGAEPRSGQAAYDRKMFIEYEQKTIVVLKRLSTKHGPEMLELTQTAALYNLACCAGVLGLLQI